MLVSAIRRPQFGQSEFSSPGMLRRLFLFPHPLELLRALFDRHEFAVGLAPFGPGGFAHQLTFELRALANGALAGAVANRFVHAISGRA
jgi:hypothetical protein